MQRDRARSLPAAVILPILLSALVAACATPPAERDERDGGRARAATTAAEGGGESGSAPHVGADAERSTPLPCEAADSALEAGGPLPFDLTAEDDPCTALTWAAFGRSVEGRPLAYVVASSGEAQAESGPTTLIFGAIHGSEQASAILVHRFVDEVARRAAIADGGATVASWSGRLVLVPIANPDGLFRGTRTNARGVDLNRNFPTRDFGRGRRGGTTEPGPEAASEPETRALLGLIAAERPARIVAVHAPLGCVEWDGPGEALARAMGSACGLPVRHDIGYPTPGSLGTWSGEERRVPTVTLELPRGADLSERGLARYVAALWVAASWREEP